MAPPERLEGMAVLVVEDEETIRTWLCGLLAREKFLAFAAKGGKEAVELLNQRKFDIILADMKMPEMGGMELGRWLHENMPEYMGKFLLATGAIGEEIEEYCQRYGCKYLLKPFGKAKLMEAIQEIAGQRNEQKNSCR